MNWTNQYWLKCSPSTQSHTPSENTTIIRSEKLKMLMCYLEVEGAFYVCLRSGRMLPCFIQTHLTETFTPSVTDSGTVRVWRLWQLRCVFTHEGKQRCRVRLHQLQLWRVSSILGKRSNRIVWTLSLPPANEVYEGYVFTGVCLSTRGGMRGCSRQGMHGCWGACMVTPRGHAWLLLGVCVVAAGGMHGCSKGACMGYDEIRRYDQGAGGVHPTGMHSC